jgi:hypothetical protein
MIDSYFHYILVKMVAKVQKNPEKSSRGRTTPNDSRRSTRGFRRSARGPTKLSRES